MHVLDINRLTFTVAYGFFVVATGFANLVDAQMNEQGIAINAKNPPPGVVIPNDSQDFRVPDDNRPMVIGRDGKAYPTTPHAMLDPEELVEKLLEQPAFKQLYEWYMSTGLTPGEAKTRIIEDHINIGSPPPSVNGVLPAN